MGIHKNSKHQFLLIVCLACFTFSAASAQPGKEVQPGLLNLERAQATLDSIYKYYGIQNTSLLRENFPFDEKYVPNYLAVAENAPNPYSYLWPFSGTFSAVNALYEASRQDKYQEMYRERVLPGLFEYFDGKRKPEAYASYIKSAPVSDRFYDDNIWIGIDFTDRYLMTGDKESLAKAKKIWRFIESGMDDRLGGGIYWCEQKKGSKNTCSNAPGSVLALKLFMATHDSSFLRQGRSLYEWTKKTLQDPADHLYFDHITLNGKIGKAKFAYNIGQMMQSAALQYTITKEEKYLTDAKTLAVASYQYFFTDYVDTEGVHLKLLKKGDIWFTAVMLRGFIELYKVDHDKSYLNAFQENMNYLWKHSRDEHGLFSSDWSGREKDGRKSLLAQAAIVEMYARLAAAEKF